MANLSAIEWFLLISALPVLPIAMTWFLPWESLIPWSKVGIGGGLYISYLSIPAWYFFLNKNADESLWSWILVVFPLIIGAGFTFRGIVEKDWPRSQKK